MRKGIIKNLENREEIIAASRYSVSVYHKGKDPIQFKVDQYTYEDVFMIIKEKYEHDLDYIQKVVIELEN